MNQVRAGTSNSLQYLIWLNSKTVKIYSVVQSVKFLLALIIYCELRLNFNYQPAKSVCLMLLSSKNDESDGIKTFEVYSSYITLASNIFKQ